jgi:hypothetical protein
MSTEKKVYEYLSNSFIERHGIIRLEDLVTYKLLSQRLMVKGLCRLIHKEKIALKSVRRDREDLHFELEVKKRNQEELCLQEFDSICQMLEVYNAYAVGETLADFISCIPRRCHQYEVIQFLLNHGGTLLDLKLIVRWTVSYFYGMIPSTVVDTAFTSAEILRIHSEINTGQCLPCNQGLIEIKQERGGLSLAGVLKPRLIQLMRNENIPFLANSKRRAMGMYFEIQPREITQCNLHYNSDETRFFNEIEALISRASIHDPNTISVLLHGPSGTGKTELALQLARMTDATVMQLNMAEIQSKWIGEAEKNLRSVFAEYNRKRLESTKPYIILMNEADGLMNKRVSVSTGSDAYHNQTQSTFLEILEDFEGVFIATTNLIRNIDPAFHRRFMFKQEIRLPDVHTRKKMVDLFPCLNYLSTELLETVLKSEWSPGAMRMLDRRVNQLARIQNLDEETLWQLFKSEGVIQPRHSLGFQLQGKCA